jgi:Transglutaminase-like superfamily
MWHQGEMTASFTPALTFACLAVALGTVEKAEAEDLFRKLPPGVFLQKRIDVPADQRGAIGEKLGGQIAELTNAFLGVQGRSIQVNVIMATDETGAAAIHATLSRMKPALSCLRRDRMVIEYVGKNLDEALMTKTSYELGLVPKPERVNYRIKAELATINRADYMACNLLFNQFLRLGGANEGGVQVPESISSLTSRFQFGRALVLRRPGLNTAGTSARFQFEPAPVSTAEKGSIVRYEFDQLPAKYGVPHVTVSLEVPVSGTGLVNSPAKPEAELTAATPHWPASEPKIRALAEQITRGESGNDGKAAAILRWLTPGKNLTYSGEMGTRWGVAKVLEQKFGRCWDFSDCFVTLCRAVGVPCRQVAGWLYASSGHVWAEYYREGKGWQQVDPTGGGELPCGIYHIAYFTSDDGEMPVVYLSMPKVEGI